MTQALSRALLLFLFVPAVALAGGQHGEVNVNTRYDVENVAITGVSESRLSTGLQADLQGMVGGKYDPAAARALAARMRQELPGHAVTLKIRRGEQAEHVKVIYEVRRLEHTLFVAPPPLVYHAYEGFSGAIAPGFESHGNYLSAGLVSNADDLLERYAGVRLRYEHRRVGTDRVQIGIEYDLFHPSFKPEITNALAEAPGVPGTYRTRRAFAPSVSVFPVRQLKLTFGGSFQNLEFHEPIADLRRAYAWTADAQVRETVRVGARLHHRIGIDYGVRAATAALDSDFVYTRHLVAANYSLSIGRHVFGTRMQAGRLSGTAPLFERFSLGNSRTLRGWNKFDVAPFGGDRLAYGSLEYRYRPFLVFYDFGAVWDAGQSATTRHGVGLGVAWPNGLFLTVGFPVRLERVRPLVMFGYRG